MALSINIKGLGVQSQSNAKGRKQSKLGAGLQFHQERFSEVEGDAVKQSTESRIDATQTKYNISFKKCEGSFYEKMNKTYEAVNEARIQAGKRRMRSDANIAFMGTLQLSDDVLEASGYDKSKKWDENTASAQKNVKTLYKLMYEHLEERSDLYGFVESATLHVDESTPHVDFLTRAIDLSDLDLNASKLSRGSKRGEKQRIMQDELAKDVQAKVIEEYGLERGQKVIDYFGLVRGTPGGSKRDKLVHLKEYEKEVQTKATELEVKDSELATRETLLSERQKELDEQEEKLKEQKMQLKSAEERVELRESNLRNSEERLKERATQLKASESLVEARESKLRDREARIEKMVQRASESLVEARKLVDEVQKDDNYKIGQAIFFAKKWVVENQNYGTINDRLVAEEGFSRVGKMMKNKANAKGRSGKQVNSAQRVRQLRDEIDKGHHDLDDFER
jgi:hypothetical protein